MIRRDFLKSLGAAFAAAVEIGGILPQPKDATVELKAPGDSAPLSYSYSLESVRVRNRFAPSGQTQRTVKIHIHVREKMTGPEIAEWCRGSVSELLKPPPGFRVVSASYTVDQTGRELSGTVEMLEMVQNG